MGEKVTVWKAFDGTYHQTPDDCHKHERDLTRDTNLNMLVELIFSHGISRGGLVREIIDNWEQFVAIVLEYEGPKAFTPEQLGNLSRLNVWGTHDGQFVHIATMSDNHLSNAYRIANESTRPGYDVYRDSLLAELSHRGLRKEVDLGESERGIDS